jgi:hypothetical protein
MILITSIIQTIYTTIEPLHIYTVSTFVTSTGPVAKGSNVLQIQESWSGSYVYTE